MSKQTPPAWITLLADELLTIVPGVSKSMPQYPAILNNWTSIIAAHAPDAEALAVALESVKSWAATVLDEDFDGISREDACAALEDAIQNSTDALAAYRSKFPKA